MPATGDVERLTGELTQDLAVASGLLSEIATCWRRAQVTAAEALSRAGTQLLSLVLAVAAITNWSVNRTPPTGASKPWILIELG